MSTDHWIKPVTLKGDLVLLRSVTGEDLPALIAAVKDGELWNLFYTNVPAPDQWADMLKTIERDWPRKGWLCFVVESLSTGKIIGSTRLFDVDPEAKRLEIGYTWYARSVQRTGVNTECKQLLLRYLFEDMQANAVEFRTDWHNLASRQAIERLGARQDGVLRRHRKMPDGRVRDTVVYSILREEWPGVKSLLAHHKARHATA